MHFPHTRLNQSHSRVAASHEALYTWETAEDFRREWRPPPEAEGFARTVQEDVTVVQAGANKVHITITMSRRNQVDEQYNSFDTLWIFTRQAGRWGVKFRSSFLDSAAATASGSAATQK
eukprot:COSAG01_NODE_4319_length_5136_cov_2.603216_3_plen_119_part_00